MPPPWLIVSKEFMWFWLREQSYFFYFWSFCGHCVCSVCVCAQALTIVHISSAPNEFKIIEEKIPKRFDFSLIIFQCEWDDSQILQTAGKSPQRAPGWGFMRRRWQNSRKPHLRKPERFMGHQATAGAQQLFARILTCLYFTFMFSAKVYQGMKYAKWWCLKLWSGIPSSVWVNRASSSQTTFSWKQWMSNFKPLILKMTAWKWWVMSQTYTSEKVYPGILVIFVWSFPKEQESLEHPRTVWFHHQALRVKFPLTSPLPPLCESITNLKV